MRNFVWFGDWNTTLTIWICGGLLIAIYFYGYVWPIIDSFRHGRQYFLQFWGRVLRRIALGAVVIVVIRALFAGLPR